MSVNQLTQFEMYQQLREVKHVEKSGPIFKVETIEHPKYIAQVLSVVVLVIIGYFILT